MAATALPSSSAMVSAMNSSAVRASMFERCENRCREIVDVFSHDSLGLGLNCSGQDMFVIGVGKSERQGRDRSVRLNESFGEGPVHGLDRSGSPCGRVLEPALGKDLIQSRACLIKDALRPSHTEEFCLGEGEQQITTRRADQCAGID